MSTSEWNALRRGILALVVGMALTGCSTMQISIESEDNEKNEDHLMITETAKAHEASSESPLGSSSSATTESILQTVVPTANATQTARIEPTVIATEVGGSEFPTIQTPQGD